MSPPLRVLCLHGYSMTGGMLREHMARVTAPLQAHATFSFIDAPFVVPKREDLPAKMLAGESARGWWKPHRDAQTNRWIFEGVDDALSSLRAADAQHGGFDCVLGFSQGAALASLAVALRDTPDAPLPTLRCAAFFGGFAFQANVQEPDYSALFPPVVEPFTLPSLHCYGAADTMVKSRSSQRLAELFSHPTVHEHQGGHVVHAGARSRALYEDWICAHARSKL